MKKIIVLLISFFLISSLYACAGSIENEINKELKRNNIDQIYTFKTSGLTGSRLLIFFYSAEACASDISKLINLDTLENSFRNLDYTKFKYTHLDIFIECDGYVFQNVSYENRFGFSSNRLLKSNRHFTQSSFEYIQVSAMEIDRLKHTCIDDNIGIEATMNGRSMTIYFYNGTACFLNNLAFKISIYADKELKNLSFVSEFTINNPEGFLSGVEIYELEVFKYFKHDFRLSFDKSYEGFSKNKFEFELVNKTHFFNSHIARLEPRDLNLSIEYNIVRKYIIVELVEYQMY